MGKLALRARGGAEVVIEPNTVLRGTLHPTVDRTLAPKAVALFGRSATMRVVSLPDLYGGKLCAALDRQHPRDLFDVKLLLDQEGITDSLFKTFLVYVVGHKGVISHVIDPREKDVADLYEKQFVDMAVEPVSIEVLLEARRSLVREIHARIDARIRQFLLSAQRGEPEWSLLGLDGIDQLPAIKWKLLNVKRMPQELFVEELATLERVLENIGT